jgi:MtaA/CmuA family methyltransferase
MNGRERVLTLLKGGKPDSLPLMPITMMAAADAIGVPYKQYATDARTLARGQAAIAERFDFDYVSAISDPGVEAADCGASILFPDDAPPAVDEGAALLREKETLAGMKAPRPENGRRMSNRVEAVRALKSAAGKDKLVEGWVEGPCAEAADLRGINRLMLDFMDDPKFIEDLFDFVADLAIEFAASQVKAGADIIGVGDAAASLVGPVIYETFDLPRIKRIVSAIRATGALVRLHVCGDINPLLPLIGRIGCDIVDADSMVSLSAARLALGPRAALLGNIDPVRVLRNGTAADTEKAIAACARDAGYPYIVGAGCEVPRGTPKENIEALTRFARASRT